MTAVNVYLSSDCACVMTDGGTYTPEGESGIQRPKVSLLPHLNAVLAVRGPMCVGPTLAEIVLATRSTFDDAQQNLGTDLQSALAIFAGANVVLPEAVNVFLVGFSEARGQFETWYVGDTDAGGVTPYIPHQCGDTEIHPDPLACDAETQRLARLRSDAPEMFDPLTHGVELMEGQARFGEFVKVGGFCQVTWIWPDAIETRIVRRWPDQRSSIIEVSRQDR